VAAIKEGERAMLIPVVEVNAAGDMVLGVRKLTKPE